VDYNQIIKHTDIVKNAEVTIVMSLSSTTGAAADAFIVTHIYRRRLKQYLDY